MTTPIEIPFSTPGAAASRAQVDELSVALNRFEKSGEQATRATATVNTAVSQQASVYRQSAQQVKAASQEVVAANQSVQRSTEQTSRQSKDAFGGAISSVKEFKHELHGIEKALSVAFIIPQFVEIGTKLTNFTERIKEWKKQIAEVNSGIESKSNDIAFKRDSSSENVRFGLRAAGLGAQESQDISKQAQGMSGYFKYGEQFGFLEKLISNARRSGKSGDQIADLTKQGMAGFSDFGAIPEYGESFLALACAKDRKGDIGRQAAALAVRKGGLSEDDEKRLMAGIKSGDVSIAASGRVSSANPEYAGIVGNLTKAGGLDFEGAHGVGGMAFSQGGMTAKFTGGRVGEATADEADEWSGKMPGHGKESRERSRIAMNEATNSSAPYFDEKGKKLPEKPSLLNATEWVELAAAVILFRKQLVSFVGWFAGIGGKLGVPGMAAAASKLAPAATEAAIVTGTEAAGVGASKLAPAAAGAASKGIGARIAGWGAVALGGLARFGGVIGNTVMPAEMGNDENPNPGGGAAKTNSADEAAELMHLMSEIPDSPDRRKVQDAMSQGTSDPHSLLPFVRELHKKTGKGGSKSGLSVSGSLIITDADPSSMGAASVERSGVPSGVGVIPEDYESGADALTTKPSARNYADLIKKQNSGKLDNINNNGKIRARGATDAEMNDAKKATDAEMLDNIKSLKDVVNLLKDIRTNTSNTMKSSPSAP